jgi:nicotinate phosphoribosyltransferase
MADAIYEIDHDVSEPCEIVDPETNDRLTIGDASAIASVGEAVGFPRDDNVVPYSGPAHFTDLLVPIFRAGQLVYEQPSIEASREHLRKQLSCAPPEILQLNDPVPYKIGLERSLYELRAKLIEHAEERFK